MPRDPRNDGEDRRLQRDWSATETTCTAKTVDAIARGAFVGLMWGIVSRKHPRTWQASQSAVRNALSSAADFAGLVGLYTGVQCCLHDEAGAGASTSVKAIASEAAAGAVAGVYYGARVSGGDPRTVAGCSLALASAAGLKATFMPVQ